MYTCVKRIMKQQNLFCFCLNDAQSTQNHTSYSTLLQVTTLIPQNSTSTCFSVPSPVMKNIIVVKASIRCVQGCKSVFLCTCERWGSSHSATSTHTRWLSKLKKKKCSQGLCCIPLHEHKQTDQKAILEGGVGGCEGG